MSIRLVAVDLDGTLFDNEKQISPANREAVARASRAGIQVAICTGRMLPECDRVLEALPDIQYAITTSGGRVLNVKTGETLGGCCLTAARTLEILQFLWQFDCFPTVMADGAVRCDRARLEAGLPKLSGWMREYALTYYTPVPLLETVAAMTAPVEKLYITFADVPSRDAAWAVLGTQTDLFSASSTGATLEITARGADKGVGLALLRDHLGLAPEEVLAIGDSDNDRPMLACAGTAVAMGNAEPEILAMAHRIAPSNTDHGVAWVLNHLIEGKF